MTIINRYKPSLTVTATPICEAFWTICDPVCSAEKQTDNKASVHESMRD